MSVNLLNWRQLVIDETRSIADEGQQRKSWFGNSSLVDSPTEQFCAFFDNASVSEFLAWPDNGLSEEQSTQLARLNELMRHLSDNISDRIRPEDLIDDPRWREIRKQAAITLNALSNGD